jgi:hypothetical protein
MSRHLMARFRHLHAAEAPSEFPWAKDDREWVYGEHGLYNPDTEAYHAPLENGHRLRVWDDTINEPHWGPLEPGGYQMGNLPAEPPKSHWKAVIDHGAMRPNDPDAYAAAGYPDDWQPSHTVVNHNRSKLRGKAHPTLEKAIRAVEQRYRKMFPLGTNTGPHDSGVDYSDLSKFMGEL